MTVTATLLEGLEAELIYDDEKGVWWQEIPNNETFVHLGFCRAPKGIWQTFWYHFYHGMLMQYGFWQVIKFSLLNLNSFEQEYFIELPAGKDGA